MAKKKDEQKALLAVGAGLLALFFLSRKKKPTTTVKPSGRKTPGGFKPADDDVDPSPDPPPRKIPGGFKPESPIDPPPQDEPEEGADERFQNIYSDVPQVGRFYQIRQGDNPYKIARRALEKRQFDDLETRLDERKLFTGSNQAKLLQLMTKDNGWNALLYGARNQNNSGYPESDTALHIGAAWLPRHKNAPTFLRAGEKVFRTIKANGQKMEGASGNGYGLIWIPEIIVGDDFRVYEKGDYEDGTPASFPPPDFRSKLTGAGVG